MLPTRTSEYSFFKLLQYSSELTCMNSPVDLVQQTPWQQHLQQRIPRYPPINQMDAEGPLLQLQYTHICLPLSDRLSSLYCRLLHLKTVSMLRILQEKSRLSQIHLDQMGSKIWETFSIYSYHILRKIAAIFWPGILQTCLKYSKLRICEDIKGIFLIIFEWYQGD